MSNVIEFLERLGRDAQLRHASGCELKHALRKARIDPAVQEAILNRDQRQLELLLGATTNVCCGLYAPREDQLDDEDELLEEDDADEDDGQDDEKASAANRRCAFVSR